MLDHLMLDASVPSHIDAVVIDTQLLSYPCNMRIILEGICKLIMKECVTLKEYLLLESIIPQYGLHFPIIQRILNHIVIDDPDALPAFFHGEISTLKGKDVIEQALVPSGSSFHSHEFLFGLDRKQPFWKRIIISIWILIVDDLPDLAIILQDRIRVPAPKLDIRFQSTCQWSAGLAGINKILTILPDVTKEKVFPSGGLIYPAGQSEIIHDVEEDLRLFSIVYVYEDHVLCDDPGIFWPVLYLFDPEKVIRSGITECHGALFIFGRYITLEDVHYLFSTYSRFFFSFSCKRIIWSMVFLTASACSFI